MKKKIKYSHLIIGTSQLLIPVARTNDIILFGNYANFSYQALQALFENRCTQSKKCQGGFLKWAGHM